MKIVFITAFEVLGSPKDGGVLCGQRNLKLLKSIFGENNVYLCAITKNKEHLTEKQKNTFVYFSNRSKACILGYTLTGRLQFSHKIENLILEQVTNLDCDIVWIDGSRMGYLQSKLPRGIKQILFMHNNEQEYIKTQIRIHPYWYVLKHAFAANEFLAINNADIIISLNSRDAGLLEKHYKRTPDLLLPITLDDTYSQSDAVTQGRQFRKLQLLFVGVRFPPNEYSIKWFINKVMPHVNAELTVVGRDFETLAKSLNRKNVTITGTVDDTAPYYYDSDVIVSPIIFGDGMKVKTAEALMYGKPMFATDEALEGYEVDGISHIYRCNSPEQFIQAINDYAAKADFPGFDKKIREVFLSKHHTPAYLPLLKELITGSKLNIKL